MVKRAAVANADKLTQQKPPTAKGAGTPAWITYLAGLGADAGTTLYGSATGKTQERNPIMPKSAGGQAAAFGGELAGMLLMRRLLKNHPGIMKTGLYGLGAAHGGAALGNAMALGQSQPSPAAPPSDDTPPFPGAVRTPSGAWINPDYFPDAPR